MKIFKTAEMLLPLNADMHRWSVVACDQYTSEPEYWNETKNIVKDSPSALNIMLPEIYLGSDGEDDKIAQINLTMERYLNDGVLKSIGDCLVYVERTLACKKVRRGIVGAVDLEAYEYAKGSQSAIRATEGTVIERIPPRLKVRRDAALEMPHIMLLIDDKRNAVINMAARAAQNGELEKLYDFELMQNGGRIKGFKIDGELATRICDAIDSMGDANGLAIAVGDGNHSLATAKAGYEENIEKYGYNSERAKKSRYAIAELGSLYDESLVFEPIHRVVFGVDPQKFLDFVFKRCTPTTDEGEYEIIIGSQKMALVFNESVGEISVGAVQSMIDDYIASFGGICDYIHGDDTVEKLCQSDNTVGFMLKAMKKEDLFPYIAKNGVLPRKTFSMGHAYDKRYYLECKRIK